MNKSVKLAALALVVGASTLAAACGTIMQGSTQQVSISSTPSGARVAVDGVDHGTTPVVASLKRKDNHVVRVTLDGYQPYEIALTRQVSGWVAGNIVFGGIIGLAVDAMTGGMYKLTPDQVNATLVAGSGTTAVRNGDAVYVAVVLTPDPSWERIGTMVRE